MIGKKILVIDDEQRIRDLLSAYLTTEGFVVRTAANGKLGIAARDEWNPDLVLLDIMMPEVDGYAFMNDTRVKNDVPIILLTAKIEEQDKIIGLEFGADDYITKPFSLRELTARIRTVLRRSDRSKPEAAKIIHGDVILDREAYLVTVRGVEVSLTRTEFDLLTALMVEPGRTFSRLQLLDFVQGVAFEGIERNIDGHIKNLRSKIEPDPHNPSYIQTVYGVGYRFNPTLEQPEG